MPVKTHPIQSSFSRGEWSPDLEGRVDIEGYKDSAHEITNWIIKVKGGLITRPGWHFAAETKDSTKESRLIPFQYSELQNYIIEIGDEYLRFFMDSGQIEYLGSPYEIVSPYLEDEIWDIRFAQDHKTLYFVHPDVQRQELIFYGYTNWEIRELESLDGPYMDEITDVTITPSAITGDITLVATPALGSDLVFNGAFAAPADVCAGGTPSADSVDGGDVAANAFDDNTGTYWTSANVAAPHYIQYLFGAGKIIVQYSMKVQSNNYRPIDWILKGSNDGLAWTDLDIQTGISWAVDEKKYFSFSNATSYTYYRIYITANEFAANRSRLTEIEMSVDYALGGYWTFGTGWTYDAVGLEADHAIDGTGELTQDIDDIRATFQYKVVFTISNYTAGSVQTRIGGTLGTARSADGTYEEYIEAADTTGLAFVPTNNFRGSIDDVEVYLVVSGSDIFTSGHIGSVFRIKHMDGDDEVWGRVQITAVLDGLHASGTVLETLHSTDPSDGYMESCWSDQNGYPRVINFHEGRTQYASNYEQPQTMWASKTHYGNDFIPGTDADSPYSLTLSTQRIIRWMQTARLLCIGCLSGEITAVGPSDAAMSVIDPPRIKDETNHGSASLQSVKINKAIIFLQEAEKKLREFSYNYENDAYSAPDITILADHMFQEGIMGFVYQQEPYSILWVLTADGILHGCTYNRETNTVGWYDVETDGEVESIAVIPYEGADQLWAIIKRDINGTDKQFVEYLDWDISLDCALTYSGVPITTVSGLDHLIGETVKVVADGGYEEEFVVSPTGSIELPNAASEIVAGLSFTPRLVTSRPEIPLKDGTSQGKFKSWNEIWLRLLNAEGLTVNGEVIPARTTDDLLGVAPDPYSGDFRVENRKWDRDGRITIEQTLPMSAEIVCLFGTLIVGDD